MAGSGRKSGRILIIVAILLVLVLAVVAFLFKDQLFGGQSQQVTQVDTQPTPIPKKTVRIVVLTQPLPLGGTISADMLASIDYPEENFIPELFFLEEEIPDLVGKQVRYPLQAGIVLTRGLVSDKSVGSYASSQIPPGSVAIAIPITRLTSVSNALQPGDHVNLIVAIQLVDMDTDFQTILPNNTGSVSMTGEVTSDTGGTTANLSVTITGGGPPLGRIEMNETIQMPIYVIPSENQRPRLISQTLIQDAVVLWVGTFDKTKEEGYVAPTPQATSEAPVQPETPKLPDQITLIVSPQDSVTLNYLMLAGAKFNLVLRSPDDTNTTPTEAVTLQFLMDQYNIPLPTKLPYGIQPRVDFLVYPENVTTTP
jgi:Flp pilus assembly protein CpaB